MPRVSRFSFTTSATWLNSASSDEARIEIAWRLCYSRPPDPQERIEALLFLEQQTAEYGTAEESRNSAWRDLCQLLLSTSEFLYLR